MYHIYLDQTTGIAKIIEEGQGSQKIASTFLTVQDFCNALAANAKMETPIIPPSCFKYVGTKEGTKAFLFYPGRDITFQMNDGRSGVRGFKITLPNTVIKAELVTNGNGKMQLTNGFIYFTDALIPNEGMNLYKPPFPNVYEDCRICFGGVMKPEYNKNNLFGVDSIFNMFFGNTANWDLFRGEMIDNENYRNAVDFMNKLEKLSKEDMLKVYFQKDKFKTIFNSNII